MARNRAPLSTTLRAVRGKRGETVRPSNPSTSPIWTEIRDRTDSPGYEGPYVSVDDVPRDLFANHPWSLGGGGAAELNSALEDNTTTVVEQYASTVGIMGITGMEEAFIANEGVFRRKKVNPIWVRPLLTGRYIQDWHARSREEALFFVGSASQPLTDTALSHWFWPLRTTLGNRATFSQRTYCQEGKPWWDWHQLSSDRLEPPYSIVVNDLATHNHFSLARGRTIFDQHSPLIKCNAPRSEEKLIDLLGVLNSSVICFRLKQVCHCRGTGGIGGGLATESWEKFYDMTTSAISRIPLPETFPSESHQQCSLK